MGDLVRESIEERYRSLSNGALLQFAETEGALLTEEALVLLRQELVRRKIGSHVMMTVKQEARQNQVTKQFWAKLEERQNDISRALKIAYPEKLAGKTDEEIIASIVVAGIPPEIATSITEDLYRWARDLNDLLKEKLLSAVLKVAIFSVATYFLQYVGYFQIAAACYTAANLVIVAIILFRKAGLRQILATEPVPETDRLQSNYSAAPSHELNDDDKPVY